jgi:hypothetical protein
MQEVIGRRHDGEEDEDRDGDVEEIPLPDERDICRKSVDEAASSQSR